MSKRSTPLPPTEPTGLVRLLAMAATTATLVGCLSLAPDQEPIPLPVANTWPEAFSPAAGTGTDATALHWRHYFADPQLLEFIEAALEHNRDLRIAVLRMQEVGAAYRIQRADRFPAFGIEASGARARVPGDLNITGESVVGGEYGAYVGLSAWELDLWGRLRNLNDAALETWLAADATRHGVQIALVAQVADAWLGLRELDERVSLAQRTIDTRQETLRIFTRRFEVGATSSLELRQVETLMTQAQALGAQLELARARQANLLAQLVGAPIDTTPPAGIRDDRAMFAEVEVGLPSDLLLARPDILAAEHRLMAANANIGAARAAFLPRIALTGNWGTASAELDGLFESGSRAWSFVPTLSLPIFDGGRRRANLNLSEVRRDITVAEYEKTIQTAFREVADALAARRWLERQVEIQRNALDAQRERARLAQLRYDNGAAPYLEVLDAQRDLLDAEQQLVQARRLLLSNQVSLYAALGGGVADPAGARASTNMP